MAATELDDLDLPATRDGRWTIIRKARLLQLIADGKISAALACLRYDISPDELAAWERDHAISGAKGLRVTVRHMGGLKRGAIN